ncbi:ribonuclease P protein component [Chryseobacterium sp. MFBS3-17]|uniref:ribonuclease P protein component n=1 Tax=Chryseobacterium sp. MFBS3-17 TaxID=2886689 RepID=UPI001D0EB715|nr:ribonuclease P protein component [Chryseobacterium sp. MFBS3-17]MCC2591273.1 ribonuclease P protein component [Chryseobacterium sp. MFBS3-17]
MSDTSPNFRYPGQEKLKSKKEITLLFEKGKWFTCGHLRIITLPQADLQVPKLAVSVSKRNFKKATDRNRVKRLLREAYRLNKSEFVQAFGSSGISMLFWASSKKPEHYQEVEAQFLKLCRNQK